MGLIACKVPPSLRSGSGIKVAVLDTGFDLGHPDFAGRPVVSQTFVGQPVQDLHSHGTHCIGTACGPKAPAGNTPRYGIAFRASIFVGKVLSNSGSGTGAGVLAGMNWAIANRCQVISMSLGSQSPVQAAYGGGTGRAEQWPLDRRCGGQFSWPAHGCPRQLADHHGGGLARYEPQSVVVLQCRQDRDRRSGPGCLLRSPANSGTGPKVAPAWPARTWPGARRCGRRAPPLSGARTSGIGYRRQPGGCRSRRRGSAPGSSRPVRYCPSTVCPPEEPPGGHA